MHLAEIWRYPVKSMAGESLEEAELTRAGVEGDRLVQVRLDGQVVTSRTRPRLLGHRARFGPDGGIRVDGRLWDDPAVAADVERAAGAGARLVRAELPEERFDILPLLVMTDGAIAAISEASLAAGSVETDRRRFRPNLLVAGVPGLAERGWEGRRLRIGAADRAVGVVVALADLRGRCVMTTFDPDTLEQEPRVLRTVVERTGGVLGLNAEVVRGGRVRVGDPVEFLDG
jgi:uncharacterized protein YcbX